MTVLENEILKQKRLDERRQARRAARLLIAGALREHNEAAAFKKSGCETWEEFEELQQGKREARKIEREAREQIQRDYCAGFVVQPTGLPNAQELANALTSVHAGGRAVRLPDLLVEAGRTDDRDEAVRLCKTRLGRDLAEALRQCSWRWRRAGGREEWVPPERKGGI